MKITIYFLFLILFLTNKEINCLASNQSTRVIIPLNDSWLFYKGKATAAYEKQYNDSGWSKINLPHCWNNIDGQDGGANYYRGNGWYRKKIKLNTSYQSKKVFIKFEGANSAAFFYINGHFIGEHKGGYNEFVFDITDYISFSDSNLICVKVDNSAVMSIAPINGDFNIAGGLHRSVSLIITNKIYITPLDNASSGIFISQKKVSSTSADISILTKLRNDNDNSKLINIQCNILNKNNQQILQISKQLNIAANSSSNLVLDTILLNPHLWDGIKDPYLYTINVAIIENDTIRDQLSQHIGIRYFSISPQTGFFLNGKSYPLHGVALHEDRKDKGNAITDADRMEDLDLIYKMGANAVRLAHYPHAKKTYEICDSLGLIVYTELALVDVIVDSVTFFDNTKKNFTEMIRQLYNHPSIVFWGLYNEINTGPINLIRMLNDSAHKEDSGRYTTAASHRSNSNPLHFIPDVIAINKYNGWYGGTFNEFALKLDAWRKDYPQTSLGVSEYGAGASIYHHEENPSAPINDGPWHPEEYQNLFHEAYWNILKNRQAIWGTFIWNMFDFSSDSRDEGDAAGINDKGLVTHNRSIKKDGYFLYKANWTIDPFVYISSRRFTQRTDSITEVKIYSNCDSVRLYVNDIYSGTAKSNPIFTFNNIQLKQDTNIIHVIGYKNVIEYTDSTTWFYQPIVNTPNFNTNTSLSIFPNPVESELTIQTQQSQTKNTTLCIYNLQGKNLFKEIKSNTNLFKINVENLPKGLYLIEISNGLSVERAKFIKN